MPDTMTLEQAQERILELTEQNTNLTTERDNLTTERDNLTTECEELRKLNQKYFNRLIAQEDTRDRDEEKEETPLTCEEFAKTLI